MQQDDIGGSGYSLDDLSAYLDRGRQPAIAAIDGNAECQAVLDSLERLGALSRELVDEDAGEHPAPSGWLDRVMTVVAGELKAGKDIPFPPLDERAGVSITEGAVRELIRAAGDAVPGALVGRVRLEGDVASTGTEDAPLTVAVTLSVLADRPITRVADDVREAVASALTLRTPVRVERIDITVDDVHFATGAAASTDESERPIDE